MSLYQAFGNGEPKAAATGSPGTGLVNPVETFKDIGQVLSRDALAGVGDGNLYTSALPHGADSDATATVSMGYGVIQEV